MSINNALNKFPYKGNVEWIGIRPIKKQPPVAREKILVSPEEGIIGDHYKGKSGERQVTLIQAEHLVSLASFIGQDRIDPLLTRRNIIISGVNLDSLEGKQVKIGNNTILQFIKPCLPCKRMEENFGEGALNAMTGLGGWCAKVIQQGSIKIGDQLVYLKPE